MLKSKWVRVVASLAVGFIAGTGGGGIVADVFGVDIAPAVYAATEGCSSGGGC